MLYAYMRVSTPHQTLENQPYALLKFADQRGFRIDAWIMESSSGAKAYTERALGPLLEQLRPQDTLLVAEISRLGRRLLDILQILHRLMDTPVTLISVKEGLEVGNTLHGKVLAFAFGLAVDLERHLLVARTREALARRRQEGQRLRQATRPSLNTDQTDRPGSGDPHAVAEEGRGGGHCTDHRGPSDHDGPLRHLAMLAGVVRAQNVYQWGMPFRRVSCYTYQRYLNRGSQEASPSFLFHSYSDPL